MDATTRVAMELADLFRQPLKTATLDGSTLADELHPTAGKNWVETLGNLTEFEWNYIKGMANAPEVTREDVWAVCAFADVFNPLELVRAAS